MTWLIRCGNCYLDESSDTRNKFYMNVFFTDDPEQAKKFRTEGSTKEVINKLEEQSKETGTPTRLEMLGMVPIRFKDALVRKIMKS